MMIIWGTYTPRRRRGRVADYCPTCRDLRAFVFSDIKNVSHLYFIPLGFGKVVGHEIKCEVCATVEPAEPQRYREMVDDKTLEVDDVAQRSNPSVFQEMVDRLDREDRALRGELSPDERMQMIVEAIGTAAAPVQKRATQLHVDSLTGLSLLAVILLPLPLMIAAAGASNPWDAILIIAGAAVGVFLLGTTIYFAATDVSRFIRKKHMATIVAGLRPIKPRLEELEAALAALKKAGLAIGKKIKAARLYDEIVAAERAS